MDFIFSQNKHLYFPVQTNADEYGILAIGGDLSSERLIFAYENGIFPWYSEDEPITWFCPDPRFVLFPEEIKIAKSMRSLFNNQRFRVTYDTCFEDVMRSCSTISRKSQTGTWIIEDMISAYSNLHKIGLAHSVEVWEGDDLVGGLYGVALGKVFFGESMFAKVSNASKFGFITLVKKLIADGFQLIDCQQKTEHLASLGAKAISRDIFLGILKENKNNENIAKKFDN
jgi:leucyl/phenylalanyl-tRNA---protein transferase